MEGAKEAEMIYNATGWLCLGGECMTGQYGFEPDGHMCFSWFMNDELVFTMYIDQLLNDGKTGADLMNSIWCMK